MGGQARWSSCGPLPASAALALWAGLAAPNTAHADDSPTARLRYEVSAPGETCPSEQSLSDLVAARIGRDPFATEAGAEVRATVSLATDAGEGLLGRVELFDPDGSPLGERTLPAPRGACRELVQAMVVSIGIALDPATTPLRDAAAPVAAATRRPLPDAERPPALRTRATRPQRDLPQPTPSAPAAVPPAELSLGTRVRVGATPGVAIGGSIGGALRGRAWAIGLEAAFVALPEQAQLGGASNDVAVLEGSVLPCMLRGPFAACLALSAGVMEVRGRLEEGVVRSPWGETGARLRWDVGVSRVLALRFEVEATVLWIVPTLRVGGTQTWSAGPITGGLSVGAVVFP